MTIIKKRTIMEIDLCKLRTLKERIIKALKDIPTPQDLHIEERYGYGYAINDAIQIINQLDKPYKSLGEDWLFEKMNMKNRKNNDN
tara:strand:- start:9424 stop:9681 length:258 start_codon:yes stop_codon:yes gene_type:complete